MKDQIEQDLPNFPPDVIEQWLLPFAKTDGWSPTVGRWRYLLFNTDLNYWRGISWQLEKVSIESVDFTIGAKTQVVGLIKAYVQNKQNMYALQIGQEGKERFKFQLEHLQRNGELIRPAVFVNHGQGYDIIDGNHRIAAYFSSRTLGEASQANPVQKIWVERNTH